MVKRGNAGWAWLAATALAVVGGARADEPSPKSTETITVAMEDCQATRPGKPGDENVGLLRLLLFGVPRERLVKRGTVTVVGQSYAIYLPGSKPYSVTESKDGQDTSTLLSIDLDGDGALTEVEAWPAGRPIRLGDRMFEVVTIAADGSRIDLKPSAAPLRGVIVGRRCPPFSVRTADGQELTREGLAGKAFLLDIWSVT